MADKPSQCKRCPGVDTYKPNAAESAFTADLFKEFIALYPGADGFVGDRNAWMNSTFMTWLNRESPNGTVKLCH